MHIEMYSDCSTNLLDQSIICDGGIQKPPVITWPLKVHLVTDRSIWVPFWRPLGSNGEIYEMSLEMITILEKYNLQEEFKALQDAALLSKPQAEIPHDAFMKTVFKDKKLNKLWLKAEQQGFSEDELRTLKEEFQHHQNKIDQYYQMINQLHGKDSDDKHGNVVEHVLQSEVEDKPWKADNPHQVLKEKHSQLKSGYEYLNSRIFPDIKSTEFEEPQVTSLWEMAKNASFSPEELESLKNELHHFEHRVKKLKTLTALELEHDDSNIVDEAVAKRNKRLKEYGYKVEKIQKDITGRILQKHTEL
ncbi:Alpha-2-macroglobulin receptor-associated like protein [Argiope bruennichi]|uniref:Alpha-2-macroglobulin receptor-associated like protein n=1 Tax=Argiope bruennichi TaxID=94029 RepID=A0A8T0F817_ARGBR|nr:Alpha-2-macroglobulin receptor-associated like protein [Argiope bruennichi]